MRTKIASDALTRVRINEHLMAAVSIARHRAPLFDAMLMYAAEVAREVARLEAQQLEP